MAEGGARSSEEPVEEVYVETLSREVWEIKINLSETVASLKKKIQRKHGVPVSGQILLFQHKELNNKAVLKEANVRNKSKIFLTLKLKSGPMHGVKAFTATDMEHSFCADITQNFNVSDDRAIFLIVEKGNLQLYVCSRENGRTYMLPIDYFGLSDCPKINQEILLNMAFNAARFPLSEEALATCVLPFGVEICSPLENEQFEDDEEISAEDMRTMAKEYESLNISEVQETSLPVVSPPTNDTSSAKTHGSSLDVKSLYHFMSFQSRNLIHGRDLPMSSNPTISPQRILSLDQWIDKRPKTMPQRKCFQSSSESSVCDISSNHLLSNNVLEEKETVLPKPVLLHLVPESKTFPIPQSLLKDRDSNYGLKLPVIHKKRSGCSKFFPEIDANILAATNLKALNSPSLHQEVVSSAGASISICRHETGAIPKLPLIAVDQRCGACKKKIRAGLGMICRCGKEFCMKHRLAEDHKCTYDYKNDGKTNIERENPRIEAPKLPKI